MEFLLVLILIIVLIVVAISIARGGGQNKAKRITDGYFYFMAFISLLVVFWGVSDLIRIMMEKFILGTITPTYEYIYSYSNTANEQWLRGLSLRISAILVAFPIWLFHWHKATSKPAAEVDISGKRSFSLAVTIVMGLTSLGLLVGALYLTVNGLIGLSLSDGEKRSFAYLVPYGLFSLGLWYSHWRMWQKSRALEETAVKTETLAPPPEVKQ